MKMRWTEGRIILLWVCMVALALALFYAPSREAPSSPARPPAEVREGKPGKWQYILAPPGGPARFCDGETDECQLLSPCDEAGCEGGDVWVSDDDELAYDYPLSAFAEETVGDQNEAEFFGQGVDP